jgi:hypothetical protein
MDSDAIEAMLREDRSAWHSLVEVLEAHAGRPLHAEGSPPWTSRDVYAHLARWMEHSTAALNVWLADHKPLPPPAGTDDEINARWQEEDNRLTLEEARRRAREAFERRVRAIQAVPPDRWGDPVLESIARADGSEHYAAHRVYVVGTDSARGS